MRLSFCIPTHDGRGAVLREALDSILCQITPAHSGQIEICISDNASQDETRSLIAEYSGRYPGLIRYGRNPENLGFTQNLLRAIALAKGDYCWLFSSDDTLTPGSAERVLEMLEANPGLTGMTVNFQARDKQMEAAVAGGFSPRLLPDNWEKAQLYTSPAQIFRECGSVQGYTSAQIFDRRLWEEALAEIGEDKFTSFTYFPYLYLFGKMVRKRPSWLWLPDRLVNNRNENDYLSAHLQKNALRYHTLTMEEASKVWGELFGRQSATYLSLMRENYRNLWRGRLLMYYKGLYPCTSLDEMRALLWFTRRLFFLPEFWAAAFPVLVLPRFILRFGATLALKLGYIPRSKRADDAARE